MQKHRDEILEWIGKDAAGFFEWLAERPWYTRILRDWLKVVDGQAGRQGLEIGCGPGLLARYLHEQGIAVTGIDRSEAMLKRARLNSPHCHFIEGDALQIPLGDDGMDFAVGASVVNVVSEPEKLIAEMKRVVRSGGRISVLFPTPRLSEKADEIAEQKGLEGLSAAALGIWGRKAPKKESAAIEKLFLEAGLQEVSVDLFFADAIASVSGRVP